MASVVGALLPLLAGAPTSAETLVGALARAYAANPALDATRAGQRATDEGVPRSLAGYRPTVTLVADAGVDDQRGRELGEPLRQTLFPRQAGLQVGQTLFDGNRTASAVRQAESEVLAGREGLRQVEQDVLLAAAQAYMDTLRDTAVLELQVNNVAVLQEQLRQGRERFVAGELTRTDIAQSEARLALARSATSAAQAGLQTSRATYRRVVGVEPDRLAPGRPPDGLVPTSLPEAVRAGVVGHPAILAALHAADAAELQVKVAEASLAPQVGVTGAVTQAYDRQFPGDRTFSASIVGRLTVPLYEGGQFYAQVRQAKETAGQRQIEVETNRNAVRQFIVQSWGQLEAAKAQVIASQAQVQANEVALNGVREEARAGQRTTLDVLNAQQELLNARVQLVIAQRDRVVFSYQVVQSVGRLTARFTSLPVAQYSPKQHFDQVKDLWYGLRTPDGR